MAKHPNTSEQLGRTLDALYWIRDLERQLTQDAERLAAADTLNLTVDERLDNYSKNRLLIIDNMGDHHYPTMSSAEQLSKAAVSIVRGCDPAKTGSVLSDTLRHPTDLIEWIQKMATTMPGYWDLMHKSPNPFEQRQKVSDLER